MLLKLLVGGSKGNVVLLVGPCDAGKTTLFHQLAEGSTHLGTVASMQANEATGPLASEKVQLGAGLAACWVLPAGWLGCCTPGSIACTA